MEGYGWGNVVVKEGNQGRFLFFLCRTVLYYIFFIVVFKKRQELRSDIFYFLFLAVCVILQELSTVLYP